MSRLVIGGAAVAVVVVLVGAAAAFAAARSGGDGDSAAPVAASREATKKDDKSGKGRTGGPQADPSQVAGSPSAGPASGPACTPGPGSARSSVSGGAGSSVSGGAGSSVSGGAGNSVSAGVCRPSARASSASPAGKDSSKAGGTSKAGSGPSAAGFTRTFFDGFDGSSGSGLNTSVYRYDTGPGSKFGTGEIETMTDSTRNVFHDGHGHLVLRALKDGNGWTSGRFETNSSGFGAGKGGVVRMEASIQQPDVTKANGAGYWPAFWMLGNGLRTGGTWPGIGEVDILEDINGRSSTFGTLHCGVNPGGPCGESTGIGSGERACGGCQTGFHTYAVEIDRGVQPERIRWYLDGANYFTLKQDRVDATTWRNAVDHPFFIIFDLAIGGGFPDAFGGGPNGSTVSGGEMKIDYLAVYNKGPA